MDNLTHTLIGLTSTQVGNQPKKREVQYALWTCAFISSNLPDLDIIYAWLFSPTQFRKLEHIVQHRGYTHSLFGVLPQAGVTVAFVILASRWLLRKRWPAEQIKRFFWISFFNLTVHIFLDSLNHYGVHPFSPFEDRWVYQDFFNFVEPCFWVILLPFVYCRSDSLQKRVLALITLGAIAYALLLSKLPLALSVFLFGVGSGIFLALRSLRNHRQWALLGVSFSIFIGLFYGMAQKSLGEIRAQLSALATNSQIRDIALMPNSSNPFCWVFYSVEERSENLITRVGIFAPLKEWISPEFCAQGANPFPERALKPMTPESPEIYWIGIFEGAVSDLKKFSENSCVAKAFVHFTRTPYWYRDGNRTILGDFRFAKRVGLGPFDLELKEPQQDCPAFTPLWRGPWADL